jgi:anti-sigma-K factor RskA
MSAQQYIESGMLELYASGVLSASENSEVESMALKHPEIRSALNEIQENLENYASLHAINPAPALRARVLDTVLNQKKASKIIPLEAKEENSRWKIIAAAAAILLLASIGINLFMVTNLSDANNQIAGLETDKNKLNKEVFRTNLRSDSLLALMNEKQRESEFLQNPMTKPVTLTSMVDGHPMNAVVHWNSESKMVAIDPMSLPATASGEMYVLWAVVNGKAVNKGAFHVTESGQMAMLNQVESAEAFAISLEKSADVIQHQGPIYVLGKVAP